MRKTHAICAHQKLPNEPSSVSFGEVQKKQSFLTFICFSDKRTAISMYRGSYSKRYEQPSSSWSVDASRILKCKVTISFRKVEAHIRRSKNLFTLQGVNKLSITFIDAVLLQCCSNTSKNIKTAQNVTEKCDHFTISSIKFGK